MPLTLSQASRAMAQCLEKARELVSVRGSPHPADPVATAVVAHALFAAVTEPSRRVAASFEP